ncbi:hypothetical protein GA0115245_145224, partial [Streptomyces sp. di188]
GFRPGTSSRGRGTVMPDLGLPPAPQEPEDTPLDFENEALLAARYPRLWERYRGD